MRESAVEARLGGKIKQMGGMYIKLMPTVAGTPDRLILLPDGRHYLVELKAPYGHVHAAQRVWHERSAAIGHPVVVVRGTEGVDRFVSTLLQEEVGLE